MAECDILIVGAGLAGAACAYQLATRSAGRIVILEQGGQPGMAASGQNAAMARQFTIDPALHRYAIEGLRFLYAPPTEVATQPLIRAVGSLIIVDVARRAAVEQAVAHANALGGHATMIRASEAVARVPVLQLDDDLPVVWSPSDGVVDVDALLQGLLRAARQAGATLHCGAAVDLIVRTEQGFLVHAGGQSWHTRILVNAAGAWGDRVAQLAGAAPRGLRTLARTLAISAPTPVAAADWPYVWDERHEVYFRPESGRLLLCPCDETPIAPQMVPDTDAMALESLYAKLRHVAPALADVRIERTWRGIRTFTADRHFCIEWDAAVPRFFWITGLGGHGVTCAAAIGREAAERIMASSW